ncbi:putative arginine/ornithine antiporter, partial [Yersinia pestis PY-99]
MSLACRKTWLKSPALLLCSLAGGLLA